MSDDPLLQPFQLKHLTLRNRIMITSHEPAYTENGMPTALYRAYHVERARGGVALTMTAGSASVSRDSPPLSATCSPGRTRWCAICACSPTPCMTRAPR